MFDKLLQFCIFVIACITLLCVIKILEVQQNTNTMVSEIHNSLSWLVIDAVILETND